MTRYSFSDLEQIWINNGGSAAFAPMAAAIAMAESGGNSDATGSNSNGSVDRGLWQINSSNGALSTTDVNGNARAAIQISNNGSNWHPWCTAFSDGACGTKGGTFLGLGSPYQKFLSGTTVPVGFSQAGASSQNSQVSCCVAPWKFHLPVVGDLGSGCLWYPSWGRALLGGIFMAGAFALAVAGAFLLSQRDPSIRAATQHVGNLVKQSAKFAVLT